MTDSMRTYRIRQFKVTSIVIFCHVRREYFQGTVSELEKEYKKLLIHNLLFGLWSLPGIIMVPVAIYRNISARRRLYVLVKEDELAIKPVEPKWSYVASFFRDYFARENQKNPMDIRESVRHFAVSQNEVPKDRILLSQIEEILQAVYEPYLDNDDLADLIEAWHPQFRASAAGISYKDVLERIRSYLKRGDDGNVDTDYWDISKFNTYNYRFRREIGDTNWQFRFKNDDFTAREPLGMSTRAANALIALVLIDIGTSAIAVLDYRERFDALKVWHSNVAYHFQDKNMVTFPKSELISKTIKLKRNDYDKFFNQLSGFLSVFPRRNESEQWARSVDEVAFKDLDRKAQFKRIDGIHARLEFLTKDSTYRAWFAIQELPNTSSRAEAIEKVNQIFTQSKISEKGTTATKWAKAWKQIESCILFNHPERDEVNERCKQLRSYCNLLAATAKDVYCLDNTFIKQPVDLEGNTIVWQYRYVIIYTSGESYLLFGGASDSKNRDKLLILTS
jgi:hypothetical protein